MAEAKRNGAAWQRKSKSRIATAESSNYPHFLFNTLNNIYFFTLSLSSQAPDMIKKLTNILHYILNECNQPMVTIEKELKMIKLNSSHKDRKDKEPLRGN